MTLVNRSHVAREIELTSYGEVVLCPAAADRAHPAFQKLFVETEWVPAAALLASRRPRSADEAWPWCVHVVASGPERVGDVTCETDRARFRRPRTHGSRAARARRRRAAVGQRRRGPRSDRRAAGSAANRAGPLGDRCVHDRGSGHARGGAAAGRSLSRQRGRRSRAELGAHRSRGGAARSRHRAGRPCALSGAGRSARLSARGAACVAEPSERPSAAGSRRSGRRESRAIGRSCSRRSARQPDSQACGNCSSRTGTGGRRAFARISSS